MTFGSMTVSLYCCLSVFILFAQCLYTVRSSVLLDCFAQCLYTVSSVLSIYTVCSSAQYLYCLQQCLLYCFVLFSVFYTVLFSSVHFILFCSVTVHSLQYVNRSNKNLLLTAVKTLVNRSARFFCVPCFAMRTVPAATASRHLW